MTKKSTGMPKNETHPTIFVLEGTILYYDEGSMLALNTQVQQEEWEQIVEETVKYKVFIECLKSTGMPLLDEQWEEEDDYFRIQLDIAVSRMRNIDPIIVASYNQEELAKNYKKQMESGAIEVAKVVTQSREAQKKAIQDRFEADENETKVSDL